MHAPCKQSDIKVYVTRPPREVYYVIMIFTKIKFGLQILVKNPRANISQKKTRLLGSVLFHADRRTDGQP